MKEEKNYKFEFEDETILKENSKKLPKLKTQKVTWKAPKEKDGVISLGYPIYSTEVDNWIKKFYDLKLADHNYLDNYEIYRSKKISDLTLEETLSYITFIIRGERFCDGHIASFLEDGTIEQLCKNL